jgi:sulfur carrier protein
MSTGIPILHVTVNGDPHEMAVGTTLPDVLQALEMDPDQTRGIAVAVNDEVIRRAQWNDHVLQDGDDVEVITAVQGG